MVDVQVCRRCDGENPDDGRFCSYCGVALAQPELQLVRRTATIMFVDLVGSTAMGEQLDPEALTTILRRYFDIARSIVESHGGTVMKYMGDAVVAVFGLPLSREDDPLRAVRATWDLLASVDDLNVDLRAGNDVELVLRAGLNTGEVAADANALEESFVFGDTANTAARLEQHAAPGTMLIGESTYQATRHGVIAEERTPLDAKGKSAPVRAFQVVAVESVQATERPLSQSTLLGRHSEIEILSSAQRQSLTIGAQTALLVGEPGLGKSRLIAEFTSSIEGGTQLVGRCLPYGDGVAYWPIREIVFQAAGEREPLDVLEAWRPDADSPAAKASARRVGRTLGLCDDEGPAASLDEVAWALEHFVRHLAEREPLVIVVDDLHWAAAPVLRLMERLSGLRDAPVLLVGATRPEFVAAQAQWLENTDCDVVELQPLDVELTATLVNDLVIGARFEPELMARIQSSAGGNPLFLEQTVRMLLDEQFVDRVGDTIVAKPGALDHVPSSLQSLIAGRIDQLTPDLSRLLARASVLGATFDSTDLELIGDIPAHEATGLADRLVQHGLLERTFPFGDEYAFRHNLIRDGSYDRLGKSSRADLHQRVARRQKAESAATGVDRDESIGFHLERAYLSLIDLGVPTEEDGHLASEAAGHLATAGRRSATIGDVDSSAELLGRAIALLEGSELRPRLQVELAIALLEVGRFDDAIESLDTARADGALAADDARLLEIIRSRILLHSEVSAEFTRTAHEEGFDAMRHFASVGDQAAQLQAGWLVVLTSMSLGAMTVGRTAIDQLLESVSPGGSPGRLPGMLALNLAWGPTPAGEALAQTAELLDQAAGDPAVEPLVLAHHAHLLGISGRSDEARSALELSKSLLERQGQRLMMWGAWSQGLGRIEVDAGDTARAEEVMREGHAALMDLGERGFASAIAGQLAALLALEGRLDEVDEFAEACLRDASEVDVWSHVLAGVARSLVAEPVDLGLALTLMDESVDRALSTEWPTVQGQTLLRSAELRARHAETSASALDVARRSRGAFESKEHIIGLRDVDRLIAHLDDEVAGNRPGRHV